MEAKIREYLDSMDGTIRHLKSIGTTSRANRDQESRFVDLGLRDRGEEKDGAEKAIFPVESLPAHRAEHFTGRDKEIETIFGHLGSAETSRLRTFLIYGRRGIGKTQIALEYCRRHKKNYDAIFWIQCETSASLRQSFADVAVALELDGADKNGHYDENLVKVLGWLKRTTKRWLLIYDNAERENILKGYWPVGARGAILLTSRSFYNFFEDDQRGGETVPLFNEQERWDLLMSLLGKEWQKQHFSESNRMAPLEKAAARVLLHETGGLPLAITQLSILIKNENIGINTPDTSVRGFLELFHGSHSSLPVRQSGPREPLFHSLDTIWSIAFDALKPNAKALLSVLALLSPDSILIDLFLPSNQQYLAPKLGFCRSGSGDLLSRPSIQTIISPSAELQEAVDELRASNFISRAGREMRIHREVQEAVNYKNAGDLRDSFNSGVNLVYDAFPKQEGGRPLSESWESCRRYIQHAIHLATKYNLYIQGRPDSPLRGLETAATFAGLLSNCAW